MLARSPLGYAQFVSFSRDGRLIAICDYTAAIRVWSAVDAEEVAVLRGHFSLAACATFHPDCGALASGGDESESAQACVARTMHVMTPAQVCFGCGICRLQRAYGHFVATVDALDPCATARMVHG